MYTNALACALVAAHGAFARPIEDSTAASITPTAEMIETIVRREGPTFSRTWTQASPATTSPGSSASTTETFGNPYEGARFTRTRSLHVVHVPRATMLAGSSVATENVGIEILTRGGLRTTSRLLVSVSLATSSVSSSVHSGGTVETVGLGPRETSIRARIGTPMHSTTKAHSPKWPILPRETAASEVPVIEDDAADYIALVELGLVPGPLVYELLNLTGTKLSAGIEVERRSGDDGGDQIDMGIDEYAKIGKELTPLAKFIVKNSDHVGSQFCYDYFVNKRDPGTPDIHTQNCILVKHSSPLRKKAPHAGQFWYNYHMGKKCFNDLRRIPCIVDLQRDTGCGWDNINKFQHRCDHFPNDGITGPVKIDTSDLSWIVPDHGDGGNSGKKCELENMDAYYNHGKQNKKCDGRWEPTKNNGGEPKKDGQS